MLNIVNKSPLERSTLESCLRMTPPESALLLIEDGVYAATQGNAAEARVREALGRIQVYALGPDLEARGLKDRVIDGVKLVDYAGFVDLAAQHNPIQSWL